MKVFFDTKKIQKLGRIALTEHLLRNAGLREGDAVNIYFDALTKRIILERAEPLEPDATTEKPATSGEKE